MGFNMMSLGISRILRNQIKKITKNAIRAYNLNTKDKKIDTNNKSKIGWSLGSLPIYGGLDEMGSEATVTMSALTGYDVATSSTSYSYRNDNDVELSAHAVRRPARLDMSQFIDGIG